MSDNQYLINYYNNYDEENRLKSRYGSVEFLTTMKYIHKYLHKGMKICEIGAGTGRYSHALSRQGYEVDAVELIEHNIEIFKQNTEASEKITIRQGNALDLSFFDDNTYDITLLLGPMYHLYNKDEQIMALSEALRITKRNGMLFVAYCISDASVISYGFIGGNMQKLIENKMLDLKTFSTFSNPWDIFELYRKEDIDSLNKQINVKRLHYIATDGFTNFMRDTMEIMDDETFDIYLKYHLSICERTDMTGMTHHSLDVLKKYE